MNVTTAPESDSDIEISKMIDDYIDGNLSVDEIENIWVFFIQNPGWYSYFETALTLRSIREDLAQNKY
ncbi:hypothetical protein CWD77_01210 [Rhodohalobacter barkolensis]|uniref:Uncharacterized protein n=1 Tax=Rhodohalobacter barkolensis TaxID=2053187 RepID=A0A2N0VIW0_9BACT|nr:hypothetical protein CWD77_01210 [Rhodohalobacter barkolensis]